VRCRPRRPDLLRRHRCGDAAGRRGRARCGPGPGGARDGTGSPRRCTPCITAGATWPTRSRRPCSSFGRIRGGASAARPAGGAPGGGPALATARSADGFTASITRRSSGRGMRGRKPSASRRRRHTSMRDRTNALSVLPIHSATGGKPRRRRRGPDRCWRRRQRDPTTRWTPLHGAAQNGSLRPSSGSWRRAPIGRRFNDDGTSAMEAGPGRRSRGRSHARLADARVRRPRAAATVRAMNDSATGDAIPCRARPSRTCRSRGDRGPASSRHGKGEAIMTPSRSCSMSASPGWTRPPPDPPQPGPRTRRGPGGPDPRLARPARIARSGSVRPPGSIA